MSKKVEGSKLGRWLGAPMRALSRACDSYVRRMTACAGRMPTYTAAYGGRSGFAPASMHAAAFRAGSDEEVNALIRALSQRQASGGEHDVAVSVPLRSRSVAVGRIDEDAPCDFGADDLVCTGRPAVRRARSVAVGSAFGPARRRGYGGGAKKQQLGAGVVRG